MRRSRAERARKRGERERRGLWEGGARLAALAATGMNFANHKKERPPSAHNGTGRRNTELQPGRRERHGKSGTLQPCLECWAGSAAVKCSAVETAGRARAKAPKGPLDRVEAQEVGKGKFP